MNLFLALFFLAAGMSAQDVPKTAAIEGRVLNAATGEPIRKATLLLRSAEPRPGTAYIPPTYSTTSGASGKFGMQPIDPGRYRLTVRRTGFVEMEYGAHGPGRPGATLALEPGQQLKDLTFKLTPHGVITGRVLDEDGEPVAYVSVETMTYRYMDGKKQLTPSGGASTNDLGEYRIFGLAPGRYYLSAISENRFDVGSERSTGPDSELEYVPTYYPGSTDPAAASLITVQPGAQLRGLDLTLSRTRTVKVKGHVTIPPGVSRRMLQVMLSPRGGAGFFGMRRTLVSDPQGRFELRGLSPGAYVLTAMAFDGSKNLAARRAIDIGNSDLDNTNIAISEGVEVPGRLRVEGDAPVTLSEVRIGLRPHDAGQMMFGPMPNASVKEDGSFVLSNVGPDTFDVTVFGQPDGYYLKAVRAADRDVLDSGVDLSSGPPGSLTIVLGAHAGQVEGVVMNEKQQPAPAATVVLIPNDEKRRQRTQAYKVATTDQYGRYTLKSVDPGDYRIFAWQDVEYGAYMDPEFVKPVEDKGESVSICEGSRESLQLKLISAGTAEQASER